VNDVVIAIPTRNRVEKLLRMLKSIPAEPWIKVVVVADGCDITYEALSPLHSADFGFDFTLLKTPRQRGSAFCRNRVATVCEGDYLFATDDIIFKENALNRARALLYQKFPDTDGVIGFSQAGNVFHPTGVALVGYRFLQRYPAQKLFFPEYFHFCCQEVHELAIKYDKFYLDPQIGVFHFHPQHHGGMDQTHVDGRIHKGRDFEIRASRKAKGLIWGDSQ